MASTSKTINILGVTGSIGQSTMDVILSAPEHFDVRLITAHTNEQGLNEAKAQLGAKTALLTSQDGGALKEALSRPVDLTIAAIMGVAGLEPLIEAIKHSKVVAIANKEPLVAAGELVLALAKEHGTVILPLDSEHNAIYQVFDEGHRKAIDRIILTASGGPFLNASKEEVANATPAQALKHPNWEMGQKISIDSATMMNKALEVIEAHYRFDMPAEKIDVIIHPQSVVHSMVEYCDGSVLAQMGASDMRTPISYAVGWPGRIQTPGERLDLKALSSLSFQEPDFEQFPALRLAYECLRRGQSACIALNAANEVAVAHFLTNHIAFPDIIGIVSDVLEKVDDRSISTLEEVLNFDQFIRGLTLDLIQKKAA